MARQETVSRPGASDVVDTTRLGLDRFDEQGHSKLAADPVALPFPTNTGSIRP